jgi:CHAT domain-containing protein
VNDLSTALLMQRFHRNLYEHSMGKASAIREAQIWLRGLPLVEAHRLLKEKRSELANVKASERLAMIDLATAHFDIEASAAAHGGKPFAHLYWWAAFQCVGAGWQPNTN